MDVCITVTLTDGVVVARSAFHHSLNYRSVVALGKAQAVTDPAEKTDALNKITDHLLPGRVSEVSIAWENAVSAGAWGAFDLMSSVQVVKLVAMMIAQ